MSHFDTAQWTDFVHGHVSSPQREAMNSHLLEGCVACGQAVSLVTRVQQECSAEPSVPENLVLAAKAVFRPKMPAEATHWKDLPRLAAELMFDSLARASLEGARSAVAAGSQMVYHAGNYVIDLQIERDPESNELALVGQLANRAGCKEPLAGITVVLTARAKLGRSRRE